ncbi:10142_t:CDS:2, partial [Acaulospora colombiana]
MNDNMEKADASQPHLSPRASSPIPIPSRSQTSSPHPNYVANVGMRITPSSTSSTFNYPASNKSSHSDAIHSKENHYQNRTTFYHNLSVLINNPAGSMSISPSSRDIVLAARNGLLIVDLENPGEDPRALHNLTKWDVADVQWNPHHNREERVASTSNQKGLIWNLTKDSKSAVECILHGHTRAISDLNWSMFDSEMIATCSVDTFIHLWDLRNPNKPSRSFCAWKFGATQVKFNLKNEFILASAHDKNVMIWDTRKGSDSVAQIAAHTTKIYGIDWSKQNGKEIITCSLDKLVK